MAQIGFGINTNDTAQESGYDQFTLGLGETLKAVAADNWKFNPLSSISTYRDLQTARDEAFKDKAPLLDRQDLNTEYKDLGLFFEQDEPQSVVDLIVDQKKEELRRQDIINRGQKGILPGTAKFITGLGVSFLDPINIGVSFIPFVGQANFARLVARTGFTTARLTRGAVEGAIGTTLIEPLIYNVAQSVQADYDLTDSFLNITFGTIIGGGLHVGVGKLKDLNTARKFKKRMKKAGTPDEQLNLYKEYYPENAPIMKKLAETSPETRRLLLAKSVGDLMIEKPVDVTPIAAKDPVLKTDSSVPQPPDPAIKTQPRKMAVDQNDLTTVENTTVNKTSKQTDLEIETLNTQLETLKARKEQENFKFDEEQEQVREATRDSDELDANDKELDGIIKDTVNCVNGR
tara:strand:- start:743 stop:1951 length:1209 start_codon:yes stop_codon:yes gene_type:complete